MYPDADEAFRIELYEYLTGNKASSDPEEFKKQCKELADELGRSIPTKNNHGGSI
jgi:hypothetical protein